jgi:hypothetical protein
LFGAYQPIKQNDNSSNWKPQRGHLLNAIAELLRIYDLDGRRDDLSLCERKE